MTLSYIGVTQGADAKILVDSISTTGYPVSKMILGAAGEDDGLVSKNNPVPMTLVQVDGGPTFDAFGRLRFSEPLTLLDSKLLYDKSPLIWDEKITNNSSTATSTHSTSHARVRMHVGNNDTIIRQTKRRFNYQNGKSSLIFMTTVFGSKTAGVTKRVGYFDANNGLFFEQDGSNLKVVIRKNGSDTVINQSSWNIDKLNGTGKSEINLNETKSQIIIIDFEWLGVGRVRFGFVIDGIIYYCHQFLNANVNDSVYIKTPNLPLRYEISSTSGSSDLDHICCSIMSEGGRAEDNIGITRSFSNDSNGISANAQGSGYPLVAIRLKSDQLETTVIPFDVQILSTTSDNYNWKLCLNPTMTATLSYSGLNNSSVETAVGQGTISNYGTVLLQGYAFEKTNLDINLPVGLRIGSTIDGVRDQLVLSVTPLSNTSTAYGSISWREVL